MEKIDVLNLVISGIPSILIIGGVCYAIYKVLNLVISGIPSILLRRSEKVLRCQMF